MLHQQAGQQGLLQGQGVDWQRVCQHHLYAWRVRMEGMHLRKTWAEAGKQGYACAQPEQGAAQCNCKICL
jgi:hypothetical protein